MASDTFPCDGCEVETDNGFYDDHDGFCPECWAKSHAVCPECGEEHDRCDLTAEGLCVECAESLVDELSAILADRPFASLAALKAAGLIPGS